jgi:hypothetical protein
MENKFYTDDFERLLKERSDEFRMYPSKRVWHSIYNDLHPGRKWPSIAMSLLIIIAVLFMGYLNNDSASSAQLAADINNNNSGNNKNGNLSFAVNSINTDEPTGSRQGLIAQSSLINSGNPVADAPQVNANSNSVMPVNTNTIVSPAVHHNSSLSATTPANNDYTAAAISNTTNVTTDVTDVAANQNSNTAGRRNSRHRNRLINSEHTNTSITVTNSSAENGNFVTTGINPGKNVPNKTTPVTTTANELAVNENELQDLPVNDDTKQATTTTTALTTANPDAKQENKALADNQGNLAEKLKAQETEKAWLENYAFYNKSSRKSWKDKMAIQFYTTPSVGYRSLSGNAKYDAASTSFSNPLPGGDVSKSVNQSPGLGLEAGVGLVYSATKRIRFKGALQLNFTNYNIHADKTSHPVLTTLLLNDETSGLPYITSRTSTLSNSSTIQPTIVHNKTYQVSLPLGVAFKLYGNNKLEWYAGASIQPSFVFGGDAFLISSDRKNYIEDPSFIRKVNVNTGIETFLSYNLGTFSLQAGPQFRYQLFSTYNKLYTNTEKLYNVGLKIGILKNF